MSLKSGPLSQQSLNMLSGLNIDKNRTFIRGYTSPKTSTLATPANRPTHLKVETVVIRSLISIEPPWDMYWLPSGGGIYGGLKLVIDDLVIFIG